MREFKEDRMGEFCKRKYKIHKTVFCKNLKVIKVDIKYMHCVETAKQKASMCCNPCEYQHIYFYNILI